MKKANSSMRGFSLVEVVIALGIVAFALIALFALLPIGLNLMRQSSSEAVAVNILTGLASDVKNSDGSEAATAVNKIPLHSAGSGIVYFDEAGRLLGSSHTNTAIFKAAWSVRSGDTAEKVPPNAHLRVDWPAAAGTPNGFVEALIVLKNTPTNN